MRWIPEPLEHTIVAATDLQSLIDAAGATLFPTGTNQVLGVRLVIANRGGTVAELGHEDTVLGSRAMPIGPGQVIDERDILWPVKAKDLHLDPNAGTCCLRIFLGIG